MKQILTALVGVLVLFQSASAQTREDFTLGGLPAYLITPDTPAPGTTTVTATITGTVVPAMLYVRLGAMQLP